MSDAEKPFVETVRIQNFGCARDVTLELTPLHALIGPNDSGKSTVLHALHMMSELIRIGEQVLADDERLDPRGVDGSRITLTWPRFQLACQRSQGVWELSHEDPMDSYEGDQGTRSLRRPVSEKIGRAGGVRLVRWDPDAMREPCELIPDGSALAIGERGNRLPAIYDAILSRNRAAFDEIELEMRRHFPTVRGIWLRTLPRSMKALGAILNDGTRVHATEISDGLLYWLAFAVLPHADPIDILLVEEPENGLHPSRIAEVVKVLREVSRHTQVIVATHSPLVINELQPNEVTILTRDEKTGTRAKRMDRTTHFQQRQQVYALGELWLSFADGVDEAALVKDSDPSSSAG